VQGLGDGVSALAPNFFAVLPKCDLGGGRQGSHTLLELNVGSVLLCRPIDAVWYHNNNTNTDNNTTTTTTNNNNKLIYIAPKVVTSEALTL